jgi:hypothetical protein
MKTISIIFIFLYFTVVSYSQTPSFEWANRWGSTGFSTYDMSIDNYGNSYVLSDGDTQDNFSPDGAAIYAPTSGCGAVSKFDVSGNLVWVKFFNKLMVSNNSGATCKPKKMFIKNDSIYIIGNYSGIINFDPNGNFPLSGGSCFIVSLDLSSNFNWAVSFGNNPTIIPKDISIDGNNNILVTGKFQNTFSLASQSITSNGSEDIFVAKWDINGVAQWIKGFGGSTTGVDEGNGIATAPNGDIYVIGNFEGAVDFNPNVGISNLTSNGAYDLFIQKLSTSGNLIWAKAIGGSSSDLGNDINIDSNGDIIFTGYNYGTVDFDAGLTINNLTPTTANAFICKWDSNSNFIWAKSIISTSNPQGFCIETDSYNNCYISGITQGTADFDPSGAVYNLTAVGQSNSFVLILTETGTFKWAGLLTGQGSPYNYANEPTSIKVNQNAVYISGRFRGQVDFNPNDVNSNYLNSISHTWGGVTNYDSPFILKLSNCLTSYSALSISQCQSYTWSENNITYTSSGIYTDTLVSNYGCDSVITLNLTILPSQSNSVTITHCNSYTSSQGNTYNSSGAYTETYTSVNGCDSVVTINLTINQNTTNTITESACGAYTAPDGQVYTQSGVYNATLANNVGCDSLITINLTIGNINTLVTANGITLTSNENGAQYQWINCTTNQAIPTATGQSYTPIVNGDYAVIVSNILCSDTSDCYTVNDVGIEDLELVELFYPNPASDFLIIKNNNSSNDLVYVIFDSFGKKVIEGSLTQKETQVSLRGLSNGAYFIEIGDNLPVKILKQ